MQPTTAITTLAATPDDRSAGKPEATNGKHKPPIAPPGTIDTPAADPGRPAHPEGAAHGENKPPAVEALAMPRRRLTPVEHAVWYATALGWSVVPGHWLTEDVCSCGHEACPTPGAHPIDDQWQRTACAHPDCVRERWRPHPGAHVLAATGPGLVVVEMSAAFGWGVLEILERVGISPGPVVDGRNASGPRFWFVTAAADNGPELRVALADQRTQLLGDITVHGAGSWLPLPTSGVVGSPVWSIEPLRFDLAGGAHHVRPATNVFALRDALHELVDQQYPR